MNPAYSVLVFTTASGAGYGMLILLGILAPLGLLPADRWFGFWGMALSLGLITLGLMASTLHLGHPERAWRALSQWRSSWLSREGCLALATYLPAAIFGIGWVFLERTDGVFALFGFLASLLALVTVVCTAMIYASLKPIRQWHNLHVVPVYLAFSLMTGALGCYVLFSAFRDDRIWLGSIAGLAVLVGWVLKWSYWHSIDEEKRVSTTASAIGLADLGRVRLLDPPHTEENFLQKEMGYQIARKHAVKLRGIAMMLGGVLPIALIFLTFATSGTLAAVLAFLALAAALAGALLERWLFFAEATHRVMLYYGADAA